MRQVDFWANCHGPCESSAHLSSDYEVWECLQCRCPIPGHAEIDQKGDQPSSDYHVRWEEVQHYEEHCGAHLVKIAKRIGLLSSLLPEWDDSIGQSLRFFRCAWMFIWWWTEQERLFEWFWYWLVLQALFGCNGWALEDETVILWLCLKSSRPII